MATNIDILRIIPPFFVAVHSVPATFFLHLSVHPPQHARNQIIPVKHQRRTAREEMNHSVKINPKCNHRNHCKHCLNILWRASAQIAFRKKPQQKNNPHRRRRIQSHSPPNPSCENIKDRPRHAASGTWKSCQNQKRTIRVEHLSYNNIINGKRNDRRIKSF